MFSAVGFDLGETLIDYVRVPLDWKSEYPRALGAVSTLLGLALDNRSLAQAEVVLSTYNTRLSPREREVEERELFGEVFRALGRTQCVDDALFDQALDLFFSVFRGSAVAVPGGRDAVSVLESRGVRVGVLTDVAYAMPRRLVLDDLALAGLPQLGELALTSAQVGWRKPRPEGFEGLAGLLGVRPDELLYVGNEQKDIVGALGAGATAALLWRSTEPVPNWGQRFTLTRLEELPDLVGRS